MLLRRKHFSFAEVVQGRDANVRVTDDGLLYAVELVMVMTGKNRDDSGKALRNLSDEIFLSEAKFTERNTGGSGSSKTKLVSFEHAIELIMVLPGKVAKETRAKFASIIRRYLAGDKSLIVEIEGNASSSSPIAQLARGGGGGAPSADPVEDHEARRKRIKREDLEMLQMEQDIQEKRIKNFHSIMGLMNTIRPDWMQADARFRLQTEDMVKNMMMTPVLSSYSLPALTNGVPALTSNGEAADPQTASLSISQLVQELGGRPLKHADACRAGALAAKRYRAAHNNEDPPKHAQWVDGAERAVNSYTEKDRALLTAVLKDLRLVKDDDDDDA